MPGLAAPAPLRLGGTIGPVGSARWDRPVENRPQDIAAAKSALYWAAYQPDDPASLPQTDYDADLSATIHNFQAINGLKRDGVITPRGETETKLNTLNQPAIQLAQGAAAGETQAVEAEGVNDAPSDTRRPSTRAGHLPTSDTARGEAADQQLQWFEKIGRALGLNQAADALGHFREGSGEPVTLTAEQLRQSESFNRAMETNQERFVKAFTEDPADPDQDGDGVAYLYADALKNLQEGESVHFDVQRDDDGELKPDHYVRADGYLNKVGSFDLDEILAYGEDKVTSEAPEGFTATRQGDVITVTGIVTHTLKDDYDFTKPGLLSGPATTARDHGRAREYQRGGALQQRVEVEIKIDKDGNLGKPSVRWIDLPAPE